jgi:hypothetical protein
LRDRLAFELNRFGLPLEFGLATHQGVTGPLVLPNPGGPHSGISRREHAQLPK